MAGARDILAERFADDAAIREKIRAYSWKDGLLVTSVKNAEADDKNVFEMYYEYEEPVNRIVPHRILAVNRGEKEEVLKVAINVPVERVLMIMWKEWIPATGSSPAIAEVKLAIEDSYKRLIQPSIEENYEMSLLKRLKRRLFISSRKTCAICFYNHL